MSISFTVSATIPASPEDIFDAWLDSDGHSAMTGSPAHADAEVGGAFDAWDGYISGRNVKLARPGLIVQTWRTTRFTGADADSQIEVSIEGVAGGSVVTLTHSNVPDGHDGYEPGWGDHYFQPMIAHFSKG
jgi:uncharacterized protein YndB with AHSA1/START domain